MFPYDNYDDFFPNEDSTSPNEDSTSYHPDADHEIESHTDDDYDDMDGDHESGLTSAGFGTDEDYGFYGEDF